ncbi:ATP-binding protein [Spiroplasma culicicola]|uniref:Histidine kinase/HSP90-like ATPase domain-containing protein n=1 Tax=Spiroplasma culicicola AES-1 TaxID=1276246 RepID=W6A720_9MOLU|nr:ATP-binding protein [Spiroplasma culicicola]AHI52761.1 hypothetical protein SCULI_v1c04200 [Spiroplasma culicicola AES-1]
MSQEYNEEMEIPRSNREYLGYIDKTTDHIYMLSEFIDNSIQSAKDHKFKNVEVKICIDKKKGILYIRDDAGGIAFKNRGIAIKNGKDETEQGDTLNMFGVGMKMASIWFGRKMTFFTKSVEDDFSYSLTLDVDKLEHSDFKVEVQKNIDITSTSGIDFLHEHGTIVKIENFHLNGPHAGRYDKKMFVKGDKKDGKALEEQIACRFSRYLKNHFLRITFSYIDDKGLEQMDGTKPLVITESTIPNLYLSQKDKNDYEYLQGKNVKEATFYKKIMKEIYNKYESMFDNDIEFGDLTYRKIIETFENQEEFKFKTKIQLDEKFNNIKIPFTFGYIKKESAFMKYTGLSVYQDDRAVISGPNTNKTKLTWLTFDKALSNKSVKVTLRFIGEIDLNNKSMFRVDNNKMGFHGTVKEDIEEIISRKFQKHLADLIDKLLDIILYKDEQHASDEAIRIENERFAKEINKHNILENCSVETENLNVHENDGERPVNSFKVLDKVTNEYKFNFIHYLQDLDDQRRIFRANVEVDNTEGKYLYILFVNKKFVGFKPTMKDEDFSVLVNPIIKLIIHSLKDVKDHEARVEKFYNIVEVIQGDEK